MIYVTSTPIDPTIIDYYLHLLPGVPSRHARRRLTLLSCHDGSSLPLTRKILDRPRLMRRISRAIPDRTSAHIAVFNATDLERTLSVRLDVPIYACDPSLNDLGSKSGSREVFREAGIDFPDGRERLRDMDDVAEVLVEIKREKPTLRKAVVKMNEGFSGEGNAVFSFEGSPEGPDLLQWVHRELPHRLRYEARNETWEHFRSKFEDMEGIVEVWIEGDEKQSPSVQCRIDPLGELKIISTHDQTLGGANQQIYEGCTFPAKEAYGAQIQEAGIKVAEVLKQRRVTGRFGVDFISVREPAGWKNYAIEINLRKGGTTHPYLMLQFLTDGDFNPATRQYKTPTGQTRCYYASDDLQSEAYKGLTPDDLIDIAVYHGLHFHAATQQGVVYHLIGALSEFGKIGLLCIADTRKRARQLYEQTVAVLDKETGTASS
jgi:hypothetical protein